VIFGYNAELKRKKVNARVLKTVEDEYVLAGGCLDCILAWLSKFIYNIKGISEVRFLALF